MNGGAAPPFFIGPKLPQFLRLRGTCAALEDEARERSLMRLSTAIRRFKALCSETGAKQSLCQWFGDSRHPLLPFIAAGLGVVNLLRAGQ